MHRVVHSMPPPDRPVLPPPSTGPPRPEGHVRALARSRLEDRRPAALMPERQNRAGHEMAVAPVVDQFGVVHPAGLLRVEAPGVEAAAPRRGARGGDVARAEDPPRRKLLSRGRAP